MRPSEYRNTIDRHVLNFETNDRRRWDDLLRFYQGRFWTEETGDSESEWMRTSVNLTFAITETALSTLIPPNPAVTALARNATEEGRIKAAEAFVNLALDVSDYRAEQGIYVQDAVLYGRGVTKTSFSPKHDLPIVRAADNRSVFFDLTARREDDIRYWIEATLLSEDQFLARVGGKDAAGGDYSREAAADVTPDTFPKWMLRGLPKNLAQQEMANFQKWVTVYEFYDMERGKVVHMAAGSDRVLMEDDLIYNPFDILTLNSNGVDCRGLSEIALISPNQEEVNNLLTYWLNIVRLSVPKGVYDPGGVEEDGLAKAAAAPLGSWTPVRTLGGRSIADSLGQFPTPQVPADALALLEKVWNNINIVSALADAQRGQVTGARTATELALVQGELRNRLRSRQNKIDRLTASVAKKMLFLMQRFMSEEKVLQVTGRDGWTPVAPDTIVGIDAAFKVVPYSPMESNRAVVQEQFLQLLQFLGNNPAVDQRKLGQVAVEIFDNPELRRHDIFLPEQPPAPAPGAPAPLDAALPATPPGGDPSVQMPAAMAAISAQAAGPAGALPPDIAASMSQPGGVPKVAGLPVPQGA